MAALGYSGRALIAMSGGVDSSVAAAAMMEDGYECVGITMRLYDNEQIFADSKTCCSLDDTEDAKRVCDKLGISHYVLNLKDDFNRNVICRFTDAYLNGRTPNPCIDCNRYLKFGALMEKAALLSCDKVVTGHYARVVYNEAADEYELRKGLDASKDQSYVLYMLSHEQLGAIRFPIGELDKSRTRQIAEEYGFVNADKPDSQDICFIPDGDYQGFLKKNGVECKPGNFVTVDGEILGKHTGICNYTYGQRKGLGISAKHPWYVCEIRPETDEVVLSDNESLFKRVLAARDVSWTFKAGTPGTDEIRCRARIRYHHREADATVYITNKAGTEIKVEFDEPQRAITPGQAVVLYDGDRVLGGGTIEGTL